MVDVPKRRFVRARVRTLLSALSVATPSMNLKGEPWDSPFAPAPSKFKYTSVCFSLRNRSGMLPLPLSLVAGAPSLHTPIVPCQRKEHLTEHTKHETDGLEEQVEHEPVNVVVYRHEQDQPDDRVPVASH